MKRTHRSPIIGETCAVQGKINLQTNAAQTIDQAGLWPAIAIKTFAGNRKSPVKNHYHRIFKEELATKFTERKVTITTSGLEYSVHAKTRMAQRGIGKEEAEYVHRHGRRIHCGGALHIFLGKKDIPAIDRQDPCIRKLEGTTLLINPLNNAEVITAYRNKQALKSIRRKNKYYQRP